MSGDHVTHLPTDELDASPTDELDAVPTEVRTAVDLDAPIADVLEALRDPELLSAWLGPWTEHDHDGSATVRTDDGRVRRVSDRHWSPEGVRWRWQDHRPEDAVGVGPAASEVTIRLTEVDGRTRLMVHEVQLHAGAHAHDTRVGAGVRQCSIVLETATWLAGLLALGAVLAASSLVRV